MKKWTKETIDEYVENHGGEGYSLMGVFPFSDKSLAKINKVYEDDDNYTDSDLADLIIELAYKEVA